MTAPITQGDGAGRLIELLERQRDIYRQLSQMSQQQSQLVADGEAESLLRVLSQRQQLIDELAQLNGHIEPFKREWSDFWPQLDAATQHRVRALIDEVQSLLDGIVQQDERDRQALSAQRDRVGEGLAQVRAGAAVNQAYGQAATAPQQPQRLPDQEG